MYIISTQGSLMRRLARIIVACSYTQIMDVEKTQIYFFKTAVHWIRMCGYISGLLPICVNKYQLKKATHHVINQS